jgi:hypothetical protein
MVEPTARRSWLDVSDKVLPQLVEGLCYDLLGLTFSFLFLPDDVAPLAHTPIIPDPVIATSHQPLVLYLLTCHIATHLLEPYPTFHPLIASIVLLHAPVLTSTCPNVLLYKYLYLVLG